MLPEIQLDKDRFENMTQEMQNMISSIYPAWSDYNAHDPGITLMELFAWLQEIQQYHMDQISETQLAQYLNLLGRSRRGRKAARVLISLHSSQPLTIKKNSRFYAGNFCFETQREITLPVILAQFCACKEQERWTVLEREQMTYDGQMEFYPFGRRLQSGTTFYLGLDTPLTPGKETALSVRVRKNQKCRRNQIEGDFLPLADLAYEYFESEAAGWKPLTVIQDESYGFLQDGFLIISCDKPMEPVQIAGYCTYALRIVLKDSGYEAPPVITGLDFGYVPAIQKRTRARVIPAVPCPWEQGGEIIAEEPLTGDELAECWFCFQDRYQLAASKYQMRNGYPVFYFPPMSGMTPDRVWIFAYEQSFAAGRNLPDGDGFPYQRILLEDKELLTEDFLLLSEDPENPGLLNLWHQVKDFHRSGPEDRHYMLDEEKGELIFGDGFGGMAPEGRLLIAGCAVSSGRAGNINPTAFKAAEYPGVSAVSRMDAAGGEEPESFEEAFRSFERSQNDVFQAVTLSDYEALAMKTPGLMLHSCRAIASAGDRITVAVMPFCESGAGLLSSRAAANIRRFLEKHRMIGTSIQVKSPEYIQISVTMQLYLKSQYRNGQQTAKTVVRDFFSQMYGRMGERLSYRELCGKLERLPGVAGIAYLTLEARGGGFTYGENGDILPPPDGVFLLKELECVALEV